MIIPTLYLPSDTDDDDDTKTLALLRCDDATKNILYNKQSCRNEEKKDKKNKKEKTDTFLKIHTRKRTANKETI